MVFIESTDPLCLADGEADHLLAGAPWRRYAVLGDSIAEGTGDLSPGYAPQPWADRVAAALRGVRPDLAYLNTGKHGVTSGQVIDDQLQRVLDFGPDLVHINCGANDLWTPPGDFDLVERNLDVLFSEIRRTGALMATYCLTDIFVGERMQALRERFAAFNELVRTVARRYDAVLVDLWQHPVRERPDALSADHIHFATAGHAIAAAEMIRALGARIR